MSMEMIGHRETRECLSTASEHKELNWKAFELITEVKLCSDCSLLGSHTLQSAAIGISMSGTSSPQNFDCVCMCVRASVCDLKWLMMIMKMILSSQAGLLCESWMRVSYLAGINGGARLAEVWSMDEDLWMDKKQKTFLQPHNTTLHHLVALIWNNVYIMMRLK